MFRRSLIALSCSAVAAAALPTLARANAQGTWVSAGALSAARQVPFAARLPDGSVLVGGGGGTTTDRYTPATNTWAPAAPTSTEREAATAVPLADGRVLVAGGRGSGVIDDTETAEIFDPSTGTWSPTGSMHVGRAFSTGVLLADGRVLVAGGGFVTDKALGAEIWDPATGQWTLTGPVVHAGAGPVTRLADGRVLAAGGQDGATVAPAEIYDPATNAWTATGSMNEVRSVTGIVTLPDGRALVAGGQATTNGIHTASRTTEIYDPSTGTWSLGASLHAPRALGARIGLLPDGRPFVSGGMLAVLAHGNDGQLHWVEDRLESTVEILDPATGTWWQSAPTTNPRSNHAAVALADGTILLAGGFREFATRADRLYPPGTTPPAPPAPPSAPINPKPLPVTLPKLSKLPSKLTLDRKGRITFSLRCTGTTACTDTLTLKTTKRKRLARTKFTVGANRKATVRVQLSKTALRSVKRGNTKVTFELATRKTTGKATLKRR